MTSARAATPLSPGHRGEAAAIILPMRFDNLRVSPGISPIENRLPRAQPLPKLTTELRALHEIVRASGLDQRRFGPETYWTILDPILASSPALACERVGESAEDRPLRMVSFGEGEMAVLAWSQMHGDESTATMALADICSFLGRHPEHALVRTLSRRLRLYFVPMLNPDGAARFQRHNAVGIDINRDARRLATPEGRALKAVHDRIRPAFGFNLHDQSPRFRVGDSGRMAAIALLAPAYNDQPEVSERRRAAMRVCGVVRRAIEPLVGGHVTRYDDAFNPRAFGDLMGAWGTSTILLESGGWPDDPQKQHLRMVNFVGILSALASIADGSYEQVDLALYDGLPPNGRMVSDLLLARGTLIAPGLPPTAADVLIEYDDPLTRSGPTIVEVGDLADREAHETVAASGLFVIAGEGHGAPDGSARIGPGVPADLVLAQDPAGEVVVRRIGPD
ncbi:MAG: peptidase M14 [Gammaproteobacteria bacterium]|nr:peptidase M14 [Gammaproteobacteria bacterium]